MKKPLDHETIEEIEKCIHRMSNTSNIFYSMAIHCHNHAFIEFCGLMNKYIDMCRSALRNGQDFRNLNIHGSEGLPMAGHDVEYLGEKLACIYGHELRKPENWKILAKKVLGESDQAV